MGRSAGHRACLQPHRGGHCPDLYRAALCGAYPAAGAAGSGERARGGGREPGCQPLADLLAHHAAAAAAGDGVRAGDQRHRVDPDLRHRGRHHAGRAGRQHRSRSALHRADGLRLPEDGLRLGHVDGAVRADAGLRRRPAGRLRRLPALGRRRLRQRLRDEAPVRAARFPPLRPGPAAGRAAAGPGQRCRGTPSASDQLDGHGRGFATANAQRGQALLLATGLQRVQQLRRVG